jgi:hypothetical protein
MFLVKSDSQRYGALIHDIKNKFTRGSDTCPAMISAAYGYIVNYHPAKVQGLAMMMVDWHSTMKGTTLQGMNAVDADVVEAVDPVVDVEARVVVVLLVANHPMRSQYA